MVTCEIKQWNNFSVVVENSSDCRFCGIKISAVYHLVLSQYTRLTDGQTDRQMDRIATTIPCVATVQSQTYWGLLKTWKLENWVESRQDKTVLSCLQLCSHRRRGQDKTRQFCLVRVGSVNMLRQFDFVNFLAARSALLKIHDTIMTDNEKHCVDF